MNDIEKRARAIHPALDEAINGAVSSLEMLAHGRDLVTGDKIDMVHVRRIASAAHDALSKAWNDAALEEALRPRLIEEQAAELKAAHAAGCHKHRDDEAVDRFAAAMKEKLAQARAKGRSGWEDKDFVSQAFISQLLREHVGKGDPRDVANFCCFLWNRGEGIAQPQGRETVDLEQFREAVECWGALAGLAEFAESVRLPFKKDAEAYRARLAEANRLLAIIDAQSANESAPDALVRIAGELERIDGHPISGIGRSLAESLRGRAHILRAAAERRAKEDGDA